MVHVGQIELEGVEAGKCVKDGDGVLFSGHGGGKGEVFGGQGELKPGKERANGGGVFIKKVEVLEVEEGKALCFWVCQGRGFRERSIYCEVLEAWKGGETVGKGLEGPVEGQAEVGDFEGGEGGERGQVGDDRTVSQVK